MVLAQLRERLRGRVVIAGVGNPLRGDDGFGPLMIQRLRGKVKAALFDCGSTPENFLGPIRRQHPDTILVLDAADFSAEPGEIRVFDSSQWQGGGFSTHNFSLGLLADFLTADTKAPIYLVAIRPKSIGFGQPMSPEVKEGCRKLQRWLLSLLGQSH
jgi:hydrogenase 3 maturation protease